jgi:hypothetical protein
MCTCDAVTKMFFFSSNFPDRTKQFYARQRQRRHHKHVCRVPRHVLLSTFKLPTVKLAAYKL